MDFFFLPFILIPIIVVCVFLFVIGKGIAEWSHNNSQPVLTTKAKVVGKRSAVGGGVHGGDGNVQTVFHVTFEMETNERHEFQMAGKEYGKLCEGDEGELTYQGTRYKGFRRVV